MLSIFLWATSLFLFIFGPKDLTISSMQMHEPDTLEVFKAWFSWILGSASSIVMLVINYTKMRDALKKVFSKRKNKR